MDIEKLIEENEKQLHNYWWNEVAEGVLNDDMEKEFENWVVNLSEEEIIKIIKNYGKYNK